MHKVFMKNIKTTKTTNFLMSALCIRALSFLPLRIEAKLNHFLHQQITLWAAHLITVFNWVPSSACFSFQEISRVRFFSKVYSCLACHMSVKTRDSVYIRKHVYS